MFIAGVVSTARPKARGSSFDPLLALAWYFCWIHEFCIAEETALVLVQDWRPSSMEGGAEGTPTEGSRVHRKRSQGAFTSKRWLHELK